MSDGANDFTLLAVWANNHNDPDGQYIEQVWKAVKYYAELLSKEKVVVMGDFNSNKIWDKQHRIANHSSVVNELVDYNIHSAYHLYFEQEQGSEKNPTFFLQRNREKPYHIDYCFLSAPFHKKIKNVEIGIYEKWITFSDHMPVIVDTDTQE